MGITSACPAYTCGERNITNIFYSNSNLRTVRPTNAITTEAKALSDLDPSQTNPQNANLYAMDPKTIQLLLNMDDSFSLKTHNENDINMLIANETKTEVITSRPPVLRLSTDEKDINTKNKRLSTIIAAVSMDELQDTIRTNYSSDLDSDNASISIDSSHESFDNVELLEKQQSIGSGRNIYRQQSRSTWHVEQIDDLHQEMRQQLVDLTKLATNEEISALHLKNELSQTILPMLDNNSDGDQLPNSNLFRNECKGNWRKSLIDKQKKEMKQHMIHLVKLQNPQIDDHENESY